MQKDCPGQLRPTRSISGRNLLPGAIDFDNPNGNPALLCIKIASLKLQFIFPVTLDKTTTAQLYLILLVITNTIRPTTSAPMY
jgi:hypothetical protein